MDRGKHDGVMDESVKRSDHHPSVVEASRNSHINNFDTEQASPMILMQSLSLWNENSHQ